MTPNSDAGLAKGGRLDPHVRNGSPPTKISISVCSALVFHSLRDFLNEHRLSARGVHHLREPAGL
jgi:hypothetical protein